jgi:hypothetical protein
MGVSAMTIMSFGWEHREKLGLLAIGISHPDGVVIVLDGLVSEI